MPPIRSINCANGLEIVDFQGNIYTFGALDIPSWVQTESDLETYLNDTWLPDVSNGLYQAAVHVFTISPLYLVLIVVDNDSIIPPDWWM